MRKPQPWKPLSRRLYKHTEYHRIEDVLFELPDGREATYSLSHGNTRVACALALTPDGRVILARQFRPGPGLLLDELPGGVVDEGESFEQAIRRELLEETGYVPGKLVPLGRFYECAYSAMERHGFLALNCTLREGQNSQALDPHEFIEVILKPLPEFLEQIRRGLCTDSEVAWSALLEAGLVRFDAKTGPARG